jgi:hypothetical protein
MMDSPLSVRSGASRSGKSTEPAPNSLTLRIHLGAVVAEAVVVCTVALAVGGYFPAQGTGAVVVMYALLDGLCGLVDEVKRLHLWHCIFPFPSNITGRHSRLQAQPLR